MDATTLPQTDHITARIRQFVFEQFPLARQRDIGDAESLLESGIVDSMGILEVVSFVESEFGIELSDEDLLADTFESVESLSQFVARRLDGRSVGS